MASRGSPLHGLRIKKIEQSKALFGGAIKDKDSNNSLFGEINKDKDFTFELKAADEHAKLLRMQHALKVSTKQAIFVDSSISDIIRTCIVLGNHKAAVKVKTEFKVSEKRWYWLKVFSLATVRDWDTLEKFSKEKKPPIGFRPFVEICLEADERGEALKYIPKLTDPRERAEEAAEAASQANDGELLGRLRSMFSQNSATSLLFDTIRDRLGVSWFFLHNYLVLFS